MVASSGGPQLPFVNLFAASAVSACTAEVRQRLSAALLDRPGDARNPPRAVRARSRSRRRSWLLLLLLLHQAATLPLDTAKVRLQLQGAGGGKYK